MNVIKITYRLPSGTRIDYSPDPDTEISEEDMAIIIKMIDGESFETLSEGYRE